MNKRGSKAKPKPIAPTTLKQKLEDLELVYQQAKKDIEERGSIITMDNGKQSFLISNPSIRTMLNTLDRIRRVSNDVTGYNTETQGDPKKKWEGLIAM